MTDEEKIEQVEQALDGTRELIAEVRALADVTEVRRLAGEDVCFAWDGEEEDLLHNARHVLGRDAFNKILKAAKEAASSQRAAEEAQQP